MDAACAPRGCIRATLPTGLEFSAPHATRYALSLRSSALIELRFLGHYNEIIAREGRVKTKTLVSFKFLESITATADGENLMYAPYGSFLTGRCSSQMRRGCARGGEQRQSHPDLRLLSSSAGQHKLTALGAAARTYRAGLWGVGGGGLTLACGLACLM